jgi:hypothetical protein
MGESNHSPEAIPEHFASIDAAAEFWDSYDLADYEAETTQVELRVDLNIRRRLVALEPGLAQRLSREAQRRGVSAETLINLWLNDRLQAPEEALT